MVLTGAGISTDSGIADFRGPQGVWTKNPEAEKKADIRYYIGDPEVRKAGVAQPRRRRRSAPPSPTPATGRSSISNAAGKLLTIVTQNVDGLHQKAGSRPGQGHRGPRHRALGDVLVVRRDARRWSGRWTGCAPARRTRRVARCGGILKSATISFGQSLDPDVIDAAQRAALACDLLLAVGSTLGVYPAAGLVPMAAQAGARVVIINDAADGVRRAWPTP